MNPADEDMTLIEWLEWVAAGLAAGQPRKHLEIVMEKHNLCQALRKAILRAINDDGTYRRNT